MINQYASDAVATSGVVSARKAARESAAESTALNGPRHNTARDCGP